MRERPILFNGAMVRAILAGKKTQTRRAIKGIPWRPGCNPDFSQARAFCNAGEFRIAGSQEMTTGFRCPIGNPGGRLWVRETWQFEINAMGSAREEDGPFVYAADTYQPSRRIEERWRPSIHMPRWACRLVLEIIEVRVERLQAISPADALAEGAMEWAGEQDTPIRDLDPGDERIAFSALWDGTGGDWNSNPWVWAITFKRIDA